MAGDEAAVCGGVHARLYFAAFVRAAPHPAVTKPERRQHMERGGRGGAVGDRDADEDVVRRSFRVFGENVEVTIVVKDAGIGELEFGVAATTAAVLFEETCVSEFGLRVFVQRFDV